MDELTNKPTPKNFVATVYGMLTTLENPAYSKARVRIFYKGKNRNGTYITDEFAETLLSSLPGTPVVGYYDFGEEDFWDHMDRYWTKAYGFVPTENINLAWEMHLDDDGVERQYACVDVILWTGRYSAAGQIVGKGHSMEIDPGSISGEWIIEEGDYVFKYTKGAFIGLCVLGDVVEPCFEGSSFYSKMTSDQRKTEFKKELAQMITEFKAIQTDAKNNSIGGNSSMENGNEELDKVDAAGQTTGPNDEAADNTAETTATNFENSDSNADNSENEENKETKPEENSNDEDENKEDNKENTDNAEQTEETEEQSDESENSDEAEENSEGTEGNEESANYTKQIEELQAELDGLKAYKAEKIKAEKEAMIAKYSNKLSEEEVENFNKNLDSYEDATQLKAAIAMALIEKENESETEEVSAPAAFALLQNYQKSDLSGAAAIVAKHVQSKK